MRIAYVGNDVFANLAMALLDDGHSISHLFSPRTQGFPSLVTIEDISRRTGVPIRRQRIQRRDVERITSEGAEALLCAAYPWRLPVVYGDILRCVNMHPAPLPEGRGPAPFEWTILTGRTQTAVTFHEIVERFDAGPILLQQPLDVRPTETTASLEYRCREIAGTAVVELFRDFDRLWEGRREQGKGTYCRVPRRADRTLEWNMSTQQLDRMLRAFPAGHRHARIGNRELTVGHAECWQQDHTHLPGTVLAGDRRGTLIATSDGFALIRGYQPPLAHRLRLAVWPVVSRARRWTGGR